MAKKAKIPKAMTLFRNISATDVDSYSRPSLFNNIVLKEKDEVITPYMHNLDSRALKSRMKVIAKSMGSALDSSTRTWLQKAMVKKNMTASIDEISKEACELILDKTIPSHLINDIFNLYYTPMENIVFQKQGASNSGKYKIIAKVNNPTMKIVTNKSLVNTMFMTEARVKQLAIMMALSKLSPDIKDKEDFQTLKQSLKKSQNSPKAPGSGKGMAADAGDGAQGDPADQGSGKAQLGVQSGTQSGQSGQPGDSGQPGQQDQSTNPGDPNATDQASKDSTQGGQADSPNSNAGNSSDPADGSGSSDGSPIEEVESEVLDDGEYNPDNNVEDADDVDAVASTGNSPSSSMGSTHSNQASSMSTIQDEKMLESMMSKIFDSPAGRKLAEVFDNEARENIENFDSLIDDEDRNKAWNKMAEAKTLRNDNEDVFSSKGLKQAANTLRSINMNTAGLNSIIRKLLDKSKNYFSSKEEPIFENILHADSLDGIIDLELLHPKLKNIFLEDIMVKDSKYLGTIDVYVDISGSMDSSCGVRTDEGTLSRMNFAKALLLRISEMKLMNELFLFNSSVRKTKNTIFNIVTIDTDGGTTIDNVITNINKTQRNSVIITDAEDSCYVYSEYAFFIGTKGANFGSFKRGVLNRFLENSQMVVFDGEDIKIPNENGYVE